jgi:hypothetical protein
MMRLKVMVIAACRWNGPAALQGVAILSLWSQCACRSGCSYTWLSGRPQRRLQTLLGLYPLSAVMHLPCRR